MNTADLVLASARAGVALQAADGSFPPGHNGPWDHPVTPVRCTAHWSMTLLAAHRLTGTTRFLDSAVQACEFLARDVNRPHGAAFLCRLGPPSRSKSNGLIGQAWAVEALVAAGERLGEPRFLRLAAEIIDLHPYDWKRHVWHPVEIDGRDLGIDRTLNQQIWFCAMAMKRALPPPVLGIPREPAVRDFLEHLPAKVRLRRDAAFEHRYRSGWVSGVFSRIRHRWRPGWRGSQFSRRTLSLGYHSFVLHGLGLVLENMGDREFRVRSELVRLLDHGIRAAATVLWELPPGENPFAYAYNPSGIEVAFAQSRGRENGLGPSNGPQAEAWIGKQVERHFDWASGMMQEGTDDPATLAARVYQVVNLPEMEIPLRSRPLRRR